MRKLARYITISLFVITSFNLVCHADEKSAAEHITEDITEEITSPGIITFDEYSVTYGDLDIPDIFWDKGVEFSVNDDNEIRYILITEGDVQTFNNISVGDSENKVKSKFLYEFAMPHQITAMFDGTEEIDFSSLDKSEIKDDYLYIDFKIEDKKVSAISIMDYRYATKHR